MSHSLFLFSFVFVLSSCRFPFYSCIAFFAFTFASLLSLVADSVILLFRLGATPPPALLASLKCACSPCVLSSFFFLALLMLAYLYFSSLPSLFRFRFGHRLFFILSFSCGYHAVSSVSVSAATRLAYDIICVLIPTYADVTFFILV